MEEVLVPAIVVAILFIGLPWLILHYITRWKTAPTLSGSDEKLLDELHEMARRLDDRMCSIERIMTAEDPNWRQQCLPEQPRLSTSEQDLDDELARMTARTRAREAR
ncbi:envelope stress response membrane protein PspB [Sphingomonas sp. BN140010]|uniref:Envelope stress response membrane protein PspB n=1 Tax=Sphingomonas arvum TaxID=2992113 RepID=A0ABT3JE29_9SPHN|nr:envelope stress response membrane protein PspB [Sphingomonas sp. BN140010]MCW3797020.1 envelope stress response membrane protein PspB [Sphingomonas sp. BN140010]